MMGARQGKTRSMERVRGEDGTLSQTSIVWPTKNLILRSRERGNFGRPEGSVKGFPSGYVSTFHNWWISHFQPSIIARTLKKGGRRTQVGNRMVCNRWMGKLSFIRDQNATNSHTAGSQQTCRPLKRIFGLNSTGTTVRRLRSTTKSS